MEKPEQSEAGESGEPQAPATLMAALKRSQVETVFIPPSIDEAVLVQAQARMARIRRRRVRRNQIAWLAAAACLAAAFLIAQSHFASNKKFAQEDINHDGRVDILDAFQLAREIKAGNNVPKANDQNADGRVDASDVAIIANRAVQLEDGHRL